MPLTYLGCAKPAWWWSGCANGAMGCAWPGTLPRIPLAQPNRHPSGFAQLLNAEINPPPSPAGRADEHCRHIVKPVHQTCQTVKKIRRKVESSLPLSSTKLKLPVSAAVGGGPTVSGSIQPEPCILLHIHRRAPRDCQHRALVQRHTIHSLGEL